MQQVAPVEASGISLASWAQATQRSVIQDLLMLAARPGLCSFALGLPAPELFPAQAFGQTAAAVLSNNPLALQYGPPSQRLKQHIVELMVERGINCKEDQIFLTSGAQQGMNLLARLLLDTGKPVLLEETIYSGFQQVLEPYQPNILTVPADPATGIAVDAVAALLESGERPALLYTVTDGHNPLGLSMSQEKRQQLVALAREYHMPIIEDDAYGFLRYEEPNVPPMRALDEDWVLYLGSFSKILAPALRTGWIIVPEELIAPLSAIKEASDIDTATFSQRTVSAYLDTGQLHTHVAMLRQEYKARRDTMLRALEQHFPQEAQWQQPSHGMFIWVELPEGTDTGKILKLAVENEQVAFVPGHAFGVGGSRKAAHCMRLNFSNCGPERIEDGMARLGRVVQHYCAGR